ncbi:uncharacterized protein [Haliotis cracherodii]|uniref:uncharacterized protein n=1 Tax=Haliotis cracherodii TaxID=6455 RepID=UPI0039ECB0D8
MSSHRSDESLVSYPSSFSDQEFHAFGRVSLDYTCPAGDSDNNVEVRRPTSFNRIGTIQEEASTDTETATEAHLSTTFTSSLFQKDTYDTGAFVIYPKCMQRMLSSEYPKIVSELEEIYRLGAFIYIGSSFQCLSPNTQKNFHKIKTTLICDMCIFPMNKPVTLITVGKDNKVKYHLDNYNLEMKSNLEQWIANTIAEFKALPVVVTAEDLQIRGNVERLIAKQESVTKVLPLPEAQLISSVEAFLQKLATCKFVQRFHVHPGGTVYLVKDLFEEFIELMEETKQTVTVYPKYASGYTTLLICELAYRLALTGHTSLHSKTEVKKEFEKLSKAQNISISITYDKHVAAENLQEGDVFLSSWTGRTILFRTEMRDIDAARRSLALAVVDRRAKIQHEKGRKRLLDLVCLNVKMMEEQLENTLSHADSKSQIAQLESLTIDIQDKLTEIVSVHNKQYSMQRPHRAAGMLPTQKTKAGVDESKVKQDHDFEIPQCSNPSNTSQITHQVTSRQPREASFTKDSSNPGDVSHMKPKYEGDQSFSRPNLHQVGESRLTDKGTTRSPEQNMEDLCIVPPNIVKRMSQAFQ